MKGSIVAAALALPGIVATVAAVAPATAQAESAPEQAVMGLKYLDYNESQPGLKRVKVRAPSAYLLTPVGSKWSVEGSAVHDDVSGASPRNYSDVSGASVMHDQRNAADLKVSRYFDRSAIGLGASYSKEHDYFSRGVSLDGRIASADNNTTLNGGIGYTTDRINPVNLAVVDQKKRTTDLMVGITQAWSSRDLVQANLTMGFGHGYFSDPYKPNDSRPNKRNTNALLLRWNHRGDNWPGTLRSSYRYYTDSYGIRAHTTELNWVQALGRSWTVTPLLRYYTQRAASFYFDPSGTGSGPAVQTQYYANDQRLSAFGAVTWGLKVDWKLTERWTADIKYERYQQRSNWRIGGDGSPGIAPFSANWLQLGLSAAF
ncbi:MAG TPA: DUF3570 domain-containing protein [Burkholderiaceae bacterium]|nr:DUF3570 domain-containing protein [Burkholderiaceae bacterium]HNB44883.1 DUF3570 domain-containing protein [Burkholderiaceae bacterium]